MEPLAMVVCAANGGVIGKDGTLPWHLPEDLRHFKAVTLGHTMIMGRKTYASIGRPLPGRRTVVVTRDRAFVAAGCEVAHSLSEAMEIARKTDGEPRLVGGSSLYREALPLATRIFLTRYHRDVEGDTTFPLDALGDFDVAERRAAETEGVEMLVLVRTRGIDG